MGRAWRARLTTSRRSLLVRKGNSPLEPWTTKPAREATPYHLLVKNRTLVLTHPGSYLPNTTVFRTFPSNLCPEAGSVLYPVAVSVHTIFCLFVLMRYFSIPERIDNNIIHISVPGTLDNLPPSLPHLWPVSSVHGSHSCLFTLKTHIWSHKQYIIGFLPIKTLQKWNHIIYCSLPFLLTIMF